MAVCGKLKADPLNFHFEVVEHLMYGEQMRAISLKYVPTAVLSRQTAGIRGKALVINLPGKPKSIRETFDEVGAAGAGVVRF
eukprot:1145002-Pelagomonas_calceolata.AAC.3